MNRTSGGLIAHYGYHVGGSPLCGSRMACAVVLPSETKGYQICKRCERRYAKMQDARKKIEARKQGA